MIPDLDQTPICFLHVPKAAGTTLFTVLRRHYGPNVQRARGGLARFKDLLPLRIRRSS